MALGQSILVWQSWAISRPYHGHKSAKSKLNKPEQTRGWATEHFYSDRMDWAETWANSGLFGLLLAGVAVPWPACGSDLANRSWPPKYPQSAGWARCACQVQFHFLGTRLKLAVKTRSEHWRQIGLLLGSHPALGVPQHVKTKLYLEREFDAALALNCRTSHLCGYWRVVRGKLSNLGVNCPFNKFHKKFL